MRNLEVREKRNADKKGKMQKGTETAIAFAFPFSVNT
jgi:hypothetical protein